MANPADTEMLFWLYFREVYLALFILDACDMGFGLENMLVSYAGEATFLAGIPSPNIRSDVMEFLSR